MVHSIILGIMNAHYTYHKGYFLLVLGLPPNDEDDGNAEDKKEHQKSNAPHFQIGNSMDTVSGQNTQAQNKKRCKGETWKTKTAHRLQWISQLQSQVLYNLLGHIE